MAAVIGKPTSATSLKKSIILSPYGIFSIIYTFTSSFLLRIIMNYIPLNRNIIVQRVEGEKITASGILLKSSQEPDTTRVLAVADDVDEVKVGDKLLVNWNESAKLEHEIYKIHINNVIGVFE
jgi:co-chaperonin GroES (HSP10)